MRIVKAVCSSGLTGFFSDDQRAIKAGAVADGASYQGNPVTPGFLRVRQAGESISVMFVLEDGQIAHGDCASVQYSGAGGRDPLFLAEEYIPIIEKYVFPRFVGEEADSFRRLSAVMDETIADGKRLHTAIRYGVSQALLDAAAKARKKLMCQIVAEEYGCTPCANPVPIFAQSGDERYVNVDKMIMKGVDAMPHGLVNNVEKKLGKQGELLLEYVGWLRNRIISLRTREEYCPVMHFDVYGTIGLAFGERNHEAILAYLSRLAAAAAPFRIRIEGPVDMEDREEQMLALRTLSRLVDERGIGVELVADEWCNTLEDIRYFADNGAGHMIQIKTPDLGGIGDTVEAVLHCKNKGVGAYLGGTCNETDRSAEISAHLAIATGPDQMLAKPGMGVDEGYMIVSNEMNRILALLR